MLEAARTERDLKRDVVIGVVETHGRYDTGALVIGLELLPRRKVDAPRRAVEEFDLDAALARKPGLILMDELAHTNAAGLAPRQAMAGRRGAARRGHRRLHHAQRPAHREPERRRRADHRRRRARDGARSRARGGDRGTPHRSAARRAPRAAAARARSTSRSRPSAPSQNFFRKGNLIALRELALRSTAERVDAQMRTYKAEHGIQRVWPTAERILVCVSPSPASARLVRAARRMAASLHAPCIAAYVETPASLRHVEHATSSASPRTCGWPSSSARRPSRLKGESAAQETIRYARAHNVTKIVLGKPTHPRWRDLVSPVVPRRDGPLERRHRRLRHLRRRRGGASVRSDAHAAATADAGAAPTPPSVAMPQRGRPRSPGSSSGAGSSPTWSWSTCSASSSSRCASATGRRSSRPCSASCSSTSSSSRRT